MGRKGDANTLLHADVTLAPASRGLLATLLSWLEMPHSRASAGQA